MQSIQFGCLVSIYRYSSSESENVSLLSSSRGCSIDLVHIINTKIHKQSYGQRNKTPPPPPPNSRNSSIIAFCMARNQFELFTVKCVFVPNFVVSPPLEHLGQCFYPFFCQRTSPLIWKLTPSFKKHLLPLRILCCNALAVGV